MKVTKVVKLVKHELFNCVLNTLKTIGWIWKKVCIECMIYRYIHIKTRHENRRKRDQDFFLFKDVQLRDFFLPKNVKTERKSEQK